MAMDELYEMKKDALGSLYLKNGVHVRPGEKFTMTYEVACEPVIVDAVSSKTIFKSIKAESVPPQKLSPTWRRGNKSR